MVPWKKPLILLLGCIISLNPLFAAGKDTPARKNEQEQPLTQDQFDKILNYLVYREGSQILDQINNQQQNDQADSKNGQTGTSQKRFMPVEPTYNPSAKSPIEVFRTHYPQKFSLSFELALQFLSNPSAFINAKKQISNRFLFYGPPGSGKSYLAQIMHQAFQLPLIYVSCSDFMDKYIGEGAKYIREVFNTEDPHGRPVIIFIDEIDGIALKRNSDHHPEYRNTVNTLLVELQKHAKNPKIFVIVATNDKDALDSAIISRFEGYTVEFKMPTKQDREKFLMQAFKDKPIKNKYELARLVARLTNNFSLRSLDRLVHDADCLYFADKKPNKAFSLYYFIPFINYIKEEKGNLKTRFKTFVKEYIDPSLPYVGTACSVTGLLLQIFSRPHHAHAVG